MALFANTTNSIVTTGMNIPIPFSETSVPPDKFSDTYTNTPNKKRFVKIFKRPNTNCSCLFLNKNIVTTDNIADIKNDTGIVFCITEAAENKSNEKIFSFAVLQRLNTKVNPPEIIPAINKYIVCILCIIFKNWNANLLFLFLKRNFANQNIYIYLSCKDTSQPLAKLPARI